MRQVQINRNLILREDGKLFNIHTGEEFVPSIANSGYYMVRHFGVKKLLHRLLMELFGPPKPGPLYEIDHINRNRLDNHLENLRWVTRIENAHNKTCHLPEGERKWETDITSYNRAKTKRWQHKHREEYNAYMREWHRKKKEGV
jgi:hypothetical protein